MSARPSITWTERRSAPPSSRWLAKEWRSTCGDTRRRTPATEAARRTIAQIDWRGDGRPPRGGPPPPPRRGFRAGGHEPLLASLARAHHVARLELDVIEPQAEAFGGAHPGRVEQLEHGAVAHAPRAARVGRLDQRRGGGPRPRPRPRPGP